ncbi:MAG: thiamine phosphate synthase [Caulobacteraceae bacterium]|jgi:thiamine-phosphate pyrophosphorylase|nr:thiamine phosphate synthase [Caulobacteraceae bacterium]
MTHRCRLYLITPPVIDDAKAFAALLEQAFDAGDVAAIQVRLKDVSEAHLAEVTKAVLAVGHDYEVAVLLNDSPELAAKFGCDGVHIGQSDGTLKDARKIMGPDAMIGVTCHDSRHLAMEASEGGADYVAFGAFFPTQTKDTDFQAELEDLTIWQESMMTPCVAIGGITVDNCDAVVEAGADFIAVCGGIWNHPEGPAAAVAAFNAKFKALKR